MKKSITCLALATMLALFLQSTALASNSSSVGALDGGVSTESTQIMFAQLEVAEAYQEQVADTTTQVGQLQQEQRKAANYLMGCVYQGDIAALHELDRLFGVKDCPIIVTGRGTVTDAIVDMLHEDGYFSNVSKYFDNSVPLSGLGALLVAKKLSELN